MIPAFVAPSAAVTDAPISGMAPAPTGPGSFQALLGALFEATPAPTSDAAPQPRPLRPERPQPRDLVPVAVPLPLVFPLSLAAPRQIDGTPGVPDPNDPSSPTSSVVFEPSPTATPSDLTTFDAMRAEVGDPGSPDQPTFERPAAASAAASTIPAKPAVEVLPPAPPAGASPFPAPAPTLAMFPPELGVGAVVRAPAGDSLSKTAPAPTLAAFPPEHGVGAAVRAPGPARPFRGLQHRDPAPVDAPPTESGLVEVVVEREDADRADDPPPDPRPPELRSLLGPLGAPPERRFAVEREAPLPAPVDDLLPPASGSDDVRIRIDADLSVRVARHGDTVDVTLSGTQETVRPLLGIGPELDASLAGSGFSLGNFGSGDDRGPAPPHDPEDPALVRPSRTPTWRSGRYA